MSGENFYDDEWTWYSPVEIGNCIYYDPPLPVELSTFTASMSITNDAVNLMWVTQTESNMIGYRILRGNSDVLAEAEDQNTLIPATNTSLPVSYMYSDTVIQPEQSYYYWLEALDMDGTNTFFGPIAITVPGEGEYTPAIPLATGISSLYPNPFNPDLTISYSVKTSLPVKIDIVNMRGQIIQTLVNENKEAGVYRQNWNGTGSDGRLCSSGVYFVRMQAGGEEYYAKAILLK
ncbi:MAG: T9SS type A sorting domain-containing protein [Candidatus Cloacimonetes bacterium]|nr:T9SS type A sorting domain-containing protein [Candidatus Cloacimonadota bacterium]